MRLFGGVHFPVDRPCLPNASRIDHMVIPMVNSMRTTGIAIDRGHFREFAAYLKVEENRISREVSEMTGHRTNLASPDQVADLLFRKLHIKPRFNVKLVPTGKREVINDDLLQSVKDLHPCVPLLQEFVQRNKLRTSFAETLPLFADANDRIHADIKLTRVVTGRIAMSDPNLMGQPTRTELGKMIRKGFVPGKGRMLGTIDLSQIQMRIAAHVSGCINMIDVFHRDGDIHSETASRMFRIPIEKLDKMLHRYPAKRAGFGVLFMITGAGLRDQITTEFDPKWNSEQRQAHVDYWSEERCNTVINDWYKVNWEIRDCQNDFITHARRFNLVHDLFGRVRMIPGVRSSLKRIRNDAEREAGNSPIVMNEVAVMKLGMAEIWKVINDRKLDCQPLLQIHDELLFEGGDNLPEYLKEFQHIYGGAVPLDVPVKSSMATSYHSWGDLDK